MNRAAHRSAFIAISMLLASAAAWMLTPREQALRSRVLLADVVPATFGEWTQVKDGSVPIDPTASVDGERTMKSPYDDVLMRTYSNGKGQTIYLALAYGGHQRQEIKIHRPELCYISQGFGVLRQSPALFPTDLPGGKRISGTRILVGGPRRVEAVSYWIRIGGIYSQNAWKTRTYIFTRGLQGRVVDGILLRVSQVIPDTESASADRYAIQERFAAELLRAVPERDRSLLIGSGVI